MQLALLAALTAAPGAGPAGDVDIGPVCAGLRAAGAELPASGCWEEPDNHAGCYIWNLYPKPVETVHWDGACHQGRAQGEGTATWRIDGRVDNVTRGSYEDGRRHGRFLIRKQDGETWSGAYVHGLRQGPWFERYADGSVAKGTMLHGRRQGWWLRRDTAGNPISRELWIRGRKVRAGE